jgi:hypothetical protein
MICRRCIVYLSWSTLVPARLKALLLHVTTGARTFWYAFIPPALFLVAAVTFGPTEQTFRLAGLGLQLLGLGLVAKQIGDAFRSFNHPTPFARTKEWFALLAVHLGLSKHEPRHLVMHPLTGTIRMQGGLPNLVVSDPNTVERRLHYVETKLNLLEKRLVDTSNEMEAATEKLQEAIAQQKETAATLRSLVEDQAIGDAHLDIVGVVWLFVGTVFAGVPQELADAFTHCRLVSRYSLVC